MNNIQIGQILVQKNFVTKAQLQKILDAQKYSKAKLGELLVKKGLIARSQLRQVLLEQQFRQLMSGALLTLNTLGSVSCLPVFTSFNQFRTRHLRTILSFPKIAMGRISHRKYSSSLNRSTSRWTLKQKYLSQVKPKQKPTVASPLEGFCHPLNGKGYLSQNIRGETHQGRMEYAYDLASPIGTPVYAMRSGYVVGLRNKYPDTGGGKENAFKFNYVQLEHLNGYRSSYIHLQQGFKHLVSIQTGDWVNAGDLIGYTGNSGWSNAPHLHIEVQRANSKSKFSKTVPFSISGTCGSLAQETA